MGEERNRRFVSASALGVLVGALVTSQIAEEIAEEATEEATIAAGNVMDAYAAINEEENHFVLDTALNLLRCFGPHRKMGAIHAMQAIFDLGLLDAKRAVDRADTHLRRTEPMLYSKEQVADVEEASRVVENAHLNVGTWVKENREALDEILRAHGDEPDSINGIELADELNNLVLAWDKSSEALHAVIRGGGSQPT